MKTDDKQIDEKQDGDSQLGIAKRCAEVMYSADAASKMLGIDVDIPETGRAIARMRVRDDMVNGFGVCHGGLIFALADTAFAFACNAYDRQSVAASASIEFLRPALLGDLLAAEAAEAHRGRTSGVYSVRVTNERSEAVALFHGRCSSSDRTLLK